MRKELSLASVSMPRDFTEKNERKIFKNLKFELTNFKEWENICENGVVMAIIIEEQMNHKTGNYKNHSICDNNVTPSISYP